MHYFTSQVKLFKEIRCFAVIDPFSFGLLQDMFQKKNILFPVDTKGIEYSSTENENVLGWIQSREIIQYAMF